MDINDLTPEQLRQAAEEKERIRRDLEAQYLGAPQAPAPGFQVYGARPEAPKPWEKAYEFEGETYLLDMRRVKSRRLIRRLLDIKKMADDRAERYRAAVRAGKTEAEASAEADSRYDSGAVLDAIADFLGPDVDEQVCRNVTARLGYDDMDEIMRVEEALMDAMQLKN